MIVAFDFVRNIAFVKFIGSHAEYDRVDALTRVPVSRNGHRILSDENETTIRLPPQFATSKALARRR